jgi:hypothetical protein
VAEPNNLSQQKTISIVDSTTFPDRNYLISKIHGVLRYSFERHKITKLENHEGKEITVEELVDQYYKDPGKYFEVKSNEENNNAAPHSTNDGGGTATAPTTAIAISTTSIQLAKPLGIKNNKKDMVSNEYCLHAKNRGKLQQILATDVKSIQNKNEEPTKLFGLPSSNNFIISPYKCHYCNYQTNNEKEYEHHVVMRHPGKPAYPQK